MSYEEIRAHLQTLTPRERTELSLDLRLLERLDDPDYIAQLFGHLDEPARSRVTREEELRQMLAARTAAA